MKNKRKDGIPALAFMASFSSAGRLDAIAVPAPTQPQITVVDRWDGQKWTEVCLEWDGTQYKETK